MTKAKKSTKPTPMAKPRCLRCRRRLRSIQQLIDDGWNDLWDQGRHLGYLCPTCQTPEETAEADVNAALLDMTTMKKDEHGRWQVRNPMAE
jgi:hypothetical protein